MLRLSSKTANGLCGNDPRLTVCGAIHLGGLLGYPLCRVGERTLNTLFFWHTQHCCGSWSKE